MTDHADRLVAGGFLAGGTALVVALIWAIGVVVMQNQTETVYFTVFACVFIVVSYGVGYAYHDLPDDIAKWRGER